ncbi:hypothetical protein GCM10027280_23730 [Micromonospora polyrhachis]|uniref:Streptomyces killer toxin-like beta/gamma crystallin domain-containing protein n=1 Tax=Micromonospora polyrhachis TaxID=1282883 RepID=A0A7W7WSX0_9ACTN|nr:beta/gamma crystallin domain-containing protein [Micromonospora polyrhachis]MBB4962494.1 hypothetical protein [Micromonospora polyrhachis]
MRKRLKQFTLGAAAALALTFALPASPAFAINSVACGNRTDFLKLDISLGGGLGTNRCFANSGAVAVDIGGVYQITSGNNKVTVNYQFGSQYYTSTLEKWQGVGFGSNTVSVYEVRIW